MNVHIYAPAGHYIGQVRPRGARLYRTVTVACVTPEMALSQAAVCMGGMHRLRVLFVDDSGYHEPSVIFEGKRA